MATDDSTRDRVRALVRDVLASALPAEEEGSSSPTASASSSAAQENPSTTQSRFINVVPEESPSKPVPDFARDESSKMVITEDDVRGLEEGARLRIAEGARLTPLAADIVRERRIELVRRTSRR